MHYFTKYIRISLFALTVCAFTLPFELNAQQPPADPKAAALEDADRNSREKAGSAYQLIDIETIVYPKDKRRCAMKYGIFSTSAKMYKSGGSVAESSDRVIFRSFVQGFYDVIREKGLEQATLDNMQEYKDCVTNAAPHSNEEREYDLDIKHSACRDLTSLVLDTLASIKERKKSDDVMDRYEKIGLDLTGTPYEDLPDPAVFFVGQLYSASKSLEYKSVVDVGAGLVLRCHM